MDQYMLLIRGGDTHKVSPEQAQQRFQDYELWMRKMVDTGRYIAGQPLEYSEGRLLTDRDTVLSDGPFMDAKEIVGGFVTVWASDLEDAVEVARKCPLLDHCQIEVRKLQVVHPEN